MSDDLVKRLRDHIAVYLDDRGHVFEDEALCDDAADRIEELEAKMAKAVKVFQKIKRTYPADAYRLIHGDRRIIEIADAAIAELKGESHE